MRPFWSARPRRLAALLLLAPLFAAFGVGALASEPNAADRALLERVLEETGVERRMPVPTWRAYVADTSRRLGRVVRRWLEAVAMPASRTLPRVVWILALSVALVALFLLGEKLVRRADRVPSPRRPGSEPQPKPATPPVALDDPWQLYRHHLEAGRTRAALEALWRAMVEAQAPHQPRPSWTSRDLLRVASHPEVRPILATLDRLRFGPTEATKDDVERLAHALREVTP